jgi:hypothetical protein
LAAVVREPADAEAGTPFMCAIHETSGLSGSYMYLVDWLEISIADRISRKNKNGFWINTFSRDI